MIIRSQEHSYEAIQVLPKEGDVLHYLGKDQDGQEVHLISMGQGEKLKEFMPILSELDGNAAFTDLIEYFLEDGVLWMVFQWKQGRTLGAFLGGEASVGGQDGQGPKHPLAERFDLGRQLMEQLILKMIPAYLQQEVLTPERIIVGEDNSPGFYYSFGAWQTYKTVSPDDGNQSLLAILKLLLENEAAGGLYPEWNTWLASITEGGEKGILEIYQEYLNLMPIFSTEREKGKGKAGFRERWKKRIPGILRVVKIAAGIMVIAAAAVGAIGLWENKVEPIMDAAAKWKAIYVDGETSEESTTEPVAEPETEPTTETDPDNGRGERYREDGSLWYKGGLKDGLYDDTGTLYYPNGEIAYQGGFAFGKKDGEGCQYTDTGVLYYEGEFKKDVFEGQGKLYDCDTGNLVYEGGFSGGKYSGQGVLYDGTTEFPKYVGNFRLGLYDGQGLEYDNTGSLLYEGEFLLGKYHGKGILYDPATGNALEQGVFRNGIFVGPEEGQETEAVQDGNGGAAGAEGEESVPGGEGTAGGEGTGEGPAGGESTAIGQGAAGGKGAAVGESQVGVSGQSNQDSTGSKAGTEQPGPGKAGPGETGGGSSKIGPGETGSVNGPGNTSPGETGSVSGPGNTGPGETGGSGPGKPGPGETGGVSNPGKIGPGATGGDSGPGQSGS